MDQEQAFLQAMLDNPRDLATRLIFADWLEERSDSRGALLRLTTLLTQETDQPNRPEKESLLRSLLEAGVQPVGPFWTNAVGMKFAWVPPGVFLMGTPENQPEREADETEHRVRLTKGLWLGLHPVTQAQWQVVLGNKPSRFRGVNLPVESVSWEDCQAFCTALRQWDGKRYELPTEAEWEYACRAGTMTPFHFGQALNGTQANCDGNYPHGTEDKGLDLGRTTVVGSYRPNAFGLHDMHGNVFEWCEDYYVEEKASDDVEDPVNLKSDRHDGRVIRGGSWHSSAYGCRSAHRDWRVPAYCYPYLGCRVCFRLD
jgi:uncharacterized protein (TIGR02996 family)